MSWVIGSGKIFGRRKSYAAEIQRSKKEGQKQQEEE